MAQSLDRPLMKLLLLGGTSEARALAKRLHPDVDLISSLAGRVPDPALPVGPAAPSLPWLSADTGRRRAAQHPGRRHRAAHQAVAFAATRGGAHDALRVERDEPAVHGVEAVDAVQHARQRLLAPAPVVQALRGVSFTLQIGRAHV